MTVAMNPRPQRDHIVAWCLAVRRPVPKVVYDLLVIMSESS